MSQADFFDRALRQQESAGLLRTERVVDKPSARRIRLPGGSLCIDFSSNSYLGLHDRVGLLAARRFVRERRLSSPCSSRMVSGTHSIHRDLERSLSQFLGSESVALFGSGFLCCSGVIEALTGSRDVIFYDERNHASLRTGVEMSRADSVAYRHADPDDLAARLAASKHRGRAFIVTDGLFSMDGDFAPLRRLSALARSHDAMLIVDDAHGIGVVGARGRGSFESARIRPSRHHVLIGTLSKTLGSYGGFVAADDSVIRFIKARCRAFIYTTAAPPFQVLAAQESLKIIRSGEGGRLRRRLRSHLEELGCALGRPLMSPIVPIPVAGGPRAVLDAARHLVDAGIFAVGMRYPTVPRGAEMIRVSVSAAHTAADIRRLSRAIADIGLCLPAAT